MSDLIYSAHLLTLPVDKIITEHDDNLPPLSIVSQVHRGNTKYPSLT